MSESVAVLLPARVPASSAGTVEHGAFEVGAFGREVRAALETRTAYLHDWWLVRGLAAFVVS
jgi:hypothetical protein